MFLGLNWDKYFPAHQAAIKNGRLRYCTPYPAYIFKALPSALNIKSAEEVCLLSNGSKYFWVCPKDFDFVEVQLTRFSFTYSGIVSRNSSFLLQSYRISNYSKTWSSK
jgi:hypothetical protein